MTGRRLPNQSPPAMFSPGDYALVNGTWWVRPPDGLAIPIPTPLVHGDQTISATVRGWRIVHGGWSVCRVH